MHRIMIVDDEALVLLDLVLTVESLGFRVFCDSTSVAEAMKCLGNDRPDAALLDIDVGGTPVWPLARVLKKRGVPTIFVSANHAHKELEGEFAHCHAIDKPASTRDITEALSKVLAAAA
jgi:CheY-like chemotaxis protein